MESTSLWPGDKNANAMPDRGVPLELISALETNLNHCQLSNETGKLFVPDGTLERILDENTVHRALLEIPGFRGELSGGAEEYARIICNEKHPFRKILALLLLTDMSDIIIPFVDLGIDDLALPIPDPRVLLSHELLGSCNVRDVYYCSKWRSLVYSKLKRSSLHHIYMRQWCLLAPRFIRRDSILHYTFTHDHVLPFLQTDFKSLGYSKVSHPSNELVRHGSFSQVRRVKIHPNHYDFGDYGVSNPNHQFAVKRLLSNDYEDFLQEVEVFRRHWQSDIHIVPLLATYEISETVTDDPIKSFCLIFPWAMGDLRWFWELNEELVGDHSILLWISRECYEITRALSHIHGDLCHPETSADSFGRHGDIKPSNILWYPNGPGMNARDLGKLVLADFGLADFHRATSRTNSRTASLPRSMTYRAPEFDTTKVVSQATDIWALGCTYLEFVTWFLRGNQAVGDEFRKYRSELDIYGINADIFFRVQQHKGYDDVLLKPQILIWMKRLYNDRSCSKYLRDFLNIIQYDMLVADRQNRQTAHKISRKLEELHLRCVGDIDYYQV